MAIHGERVANICDNDCTQMFLILALDHSIHFPPLTDVVHVQPNLLD
jgi:hypothetical protein